MVLICFLEDWKILSAKLSELEILELLQWRGKKDSELSMLDCICLCKAGRFVRKIFSLEDLEDNPFNKAITVEREKNITENLLCWLGGKTM